MSLATSNRDGGKTSESGHLRALYKAFGSGVISGLNVSQRGAGANMSVDVAIGDSIIGRSDLTYGHPAWNDAILNKTVTAADGSNPRRDIVVLYIDYNQAPSTAVSNNTNGVVACIIVAGTPAGSPSDPSDVTIQAAVGSGNPWIKLARVRVGAGVTTLANSVIDDLRTMITPSINTSIDTARAETVFDHVVAGGCVIAGDAYASTRLASMTAGVVYINGKRLTVAAVNNRTYTASRDTYVDASDNGDGTALLTYTEVTNNNTSPALAANSVRVGIVVTGASNIASVASINQGQEDKVLPIVSSIPYTTTDSIGNLICPRDPQRKILGYRQLISGASTTSTSVVQITGLTCPCIVPAGRKIVVSVYSGYAYASGTARGVIQAWDGTVGSGTQLAEAWTNGVNGNYNAGNGKAERQTTYAAGGAKTFNGGYLIAPSGTLTFGAAATAPAFIKVELK